MSDAMRIDGKDYARVPFGGERDREDSPCPGCGVYYGDEHDPGCEVEECPRCGGPLAKCTCFGAPHAG